MQYQESYTQFDTGLLELVKKAIPASFITALEENGTTLAFPQDRELGLKLKYDVSEEGGKFSLKFTWDNESENDEENEEEDD